VKRFLDGAPIRFRQQNGAAAFAMDLHRLVGLPNLIDQGIKAPAGLGGRNTGHAPLANVRNIVPVVRGDTDETGFSDLYAVLSQRIGMQHTLQRQRKISAVAGGQGELRAAGRGQDDGVRHLEAMLLA
jgi:hypothetical protein